MLVWQAGVSWDGVAGTDRHMVAHIAEHMDVLWVDPPLSVVHPIRERALLSTLRAPRLTRVSEAILRLTPLVSPFPNRVGVDVATNLVVKHLIRRSVRRSAREVVAVVATSPHPPLTVLPGAPRVYYATDDFVAGAGLLGEARQRFRRIELRRVEEADVLAAISPEILARWEIGPRPAHVVPNGCDLTHFSRVDEAPFPADVTLPQPIAGLVGQLTPRVDLSLLEAVAAAGISLLVVGPRQASFEPGRVERLLGRPNVQWVGEKRFSELPSYLRLIQVGLTPYVKDAFNLASFPLKTLEYLAAGRPVVSTELPAVARLGSQWIRSASAPSEFVQAVRDALAEGLTPETCAQRRGFAATHDWSKRAETFLELIDLERASH
jgi:teichuronic acid biosynthesis glycosyltransferase TuaH